MLPIANFARLNLCEFNWRIYIFNDFSIAHPEPQVRTGNHSKCFIFFLSFVIWAFASQLIDLSLD